jgi:hypothetical protein
MSVRIRIGLAAALLALFALLVCGCGKKPEEKMMEKALTEATGKETKVNIEEGNVHVEDKDSKTDMVSTSTWPADMFADVPQFTAGTIERVVSSNEGGMKKFNIYFIGIKDDAIRKYSDSLKEKGWQPNLMEMGGKGGMLNAQKGNLGMNFAFSAETKKGTLAVFSTP